MLPRGLCRGVRIEIVVAEVAMFRAFSRLVLVLEGCLVAARVRGSTILYPGQRFLATVDAVRYERGGLGVHLLLHLSDLASLGFVAPPVRVPGQVPQFNYEDETLEYLQLGAKDIEEIDAQQRDRGNAPGRGTPGPTTRPGSAAAVAAAVAAPMAATAGTDLTRKALWLPESSETRVARATKMRRLLYDSSVLRTMSILGPIHTPAIHTTVPHALDLQPNVGEMLEGLRSILELDSDESESGESGELGSGNEHISPQVEIIDLLSSDDEPIKVEPQAAVPLVNEPGPEPQPEPELELELEAAHDPVLLTPEKTEFVRPIVAPAAPESAEMIPVAPAAHTAPEIVDVDAEIVDVGPAPEVTQTPVPEPEPVPAPVSAPAAESTQAPESVAPKLPTTTHRPPLGLYHHPNQDINLADMEAKALALVAE